MGNPGSYIYIMHSELCNVESHDGSPVQREAGERDGGFESVGGGVC